LAMGSTTYGTINDPKGGVAKVTCRTFEAMGQILMFHRTYFLLFNMFPTANLTENIYWKVNFSFLPISIRRRLRMFGISHAAFYASLYFLRASAMLKHVLAIGWTSVRPSVCLSHAGIVSKRLNILSCFIIR